MSAETYGVKSSDGKVTVTVNRSGDSTGAASVSYATADGTAVAGKQYTKTSGSLSWAAGDAGAKTLDVPVTNTTGETSNKTFTVTLSGASGASLGKPSSATITIAPPGSGNSSLKVSVSGKNLVDANGQVIQLRGVNVSGLEFISAQGWSPSNPWGGQTGDATPNWEAIKTWKSNVVRIPLNEASWLGYQCTDATGASRDPDPGHNYQDTVRSAVEGATAAGLYVILDLHWTAPGKFCPLEQNPMADMDNSIPFWTSIANMFKGYPNVLFELFNEPYFFWTDGTDQWTILRDGGNFNQYVTGGSDTYTKAYNWKSAGMQQMLDAVRATGATNVVLVGSPTWAQDMSKWVQYQPSDSLKQIAAVWHAYPNSGTVGDPQAAVPKLGDQAWGWAQSVLDANVPLVITETGDHNEPGTAGSPFVSKVLPWADKNGASYLGWTWDVWGNYDNVLIKDKDGTPTSGYGEYFKAHMLCVDQAQDKATCK